MSADIHPLAIVDPKAELGAGAKIGPFCTVGPHVTLHDNVKLVSHVNLEGRISIGADCELYPGVNIGFPPQDFKHKGGDVRVEIGERNIFREHVNIHPGTDCGKAVTRVGNDCFIMVGCHLAHDTETGDGVVMANYTQIGGFVTVGDYANLGAMVGIHQHTRIGHYAFVGGQTWVNADVIPYGSVIGNAVAGQLAGLNIIGLRRRGLDRHEIRDLRSAYRLLFAQEGVFAERLKDVAKLYGENQRVMEIVDFIRSQNKRPVCMPHTGN